MSLTEIMSSADLSIYPQIAMILFLGVFMLISLRVLFKLRPSDAQKLAHLALDDDTPSTDTTNTMGPGPDHKGDALS